MSGFKNFIEVDVKLLTFAPWNYKQEDEPLSGKLKANIQKRGQIENLLVREMPGKKFEVVNGNHRLKVLQELKIKKAVVYNLGKIDLILAKRIAIETNETKFKADDQKLGLLLSELRDKFDIDELLESMPFEKPEIDALTSMGQEKASGSSSDSGSSGSGEDNEDWKTVRLRLPEGVADQVEQQIERFKKALHPNDDPANVSPVLAVEAMVQHLAQIPDEQLV